MWKLGSPSENNVKSLILFFLLDLLPTYLLRLEKKQSEVKCSDVKYVLHVKHFLFSLFS